MIMRLFVPSVAVPEGVVRPVPKLCGPLIVPSRRRTQLARVFGGIEAPPHERLTSAWLSCQKGGPLHEARVCLRCNRYMTHTFTPDGERVQVSCVWDGSETVESVMTDASVLVSVPREMHCFDAAGVGDRFGVRHLLVMDHSRLAGIVCTVDLRGSDAADTPVCNHMVAQPWALEPGWTLSDAATAMHNLRVGFFPIVERKRVVGVLTRGDLRRCGFDERELGAHECDACGSRREVRAQKHDRSVRLCSGCADASAAHGADTPAPAY